MSTNSVVLRGNLTRDPELRRTGQGMAVAAFTLAQNERRRDKVQGTLTDVAHFFECKAFGKTAETVEQYLRKGSNVIVTGRLAYETWEAKDGAKRSRVAVVADRIDFVKTVDVSDENQDRGHDPASENQDPRPPRQDRSPPPQSKSTFQSDADEQLPF